LPAESRIQTIIDRQESTHGRWQLFVAVIAIALGGVYAMRSSRDFADDLGILTGVYSAIVLLVRGLWSLLRSERAPTITVSQIDSLSWAIERQWRPEIVKRLLRHNRIDVAWRLVHDPHRPGSQWRPVPDWLGPPVVPGADPDAACQLTEGTAADLPNLYLSLPAGRLVILGPPGSGKTSILLTMLVQALTERRSRPADARAAVPVPVFLSLVDWQPEHTGLTDFVAETLARDIPGLRTESPVGASVRELVESGALCLFLDGLEEMVDRDLAIRQMNYAAHLRMVLTSRPEEYAEAVATEPLEGAVLVELLPVSEAASRDYVARANQHGTDWDRVLRRLADLSSTASAAQLNSPLYLSLLTQFYRQRSPAELLDENRFPTATSIAAHLIDEIIPRAYPKARGWSAAQVKIWFSYLARQLTHHPGGAAPLGQPAPLSWSYISEWAPAWLTRSVYSVSFGLLLAASSWLAVAGSRNDPPIPAASFGSVALLWGATGAASYALALAFDLRLIRLPVVGMAIGLATGVGFGMLGGLLVTLKLLDDGQIRAVGPALLIGDALGFVLGTGLALVMVLVGLRSDSMSKRRQWPSAFGLGPPSWSTAGILGLLCSLFLASHHFTKAAVALTLASFLAALGADALLTAQDSARGATSARQSVRHDLAAWTAIGVVTGVCGTLLLGTAFETRPAALPGWFAVFFTVALLSSHTSGYLLAAGYLSATGRLPITPLRFLDAAVDREVMRRNGWRYEFRHRTLLERLGHDPKTTVPQKSDPGTTASERRPLP
jgi:hypothetical protein